MMLKSRMKDPDTMMRIGLVCLVLANLSHFFLHPGGRLGQDLVDGVFGLLIGLTIGCLLVSIWRRGRGDSGDGTTR